jgi:hypothetical protein
MRRKESEFTKTICAGLFLAFLVVFGSLQTLADTPLWSFKGAKWYSMMETGNVMNKGELSAFKIVEQDEQTANDEEDEKKDSKNK